MSFSSALGVALVTEALTAPPASLPNDDTVSEEAQEAPPRSTSPSEPDVLGNAWEQRPLSLELHVGIATPTGVFGGVLDYSILPWLSLGCGVGTNFVGPAGECRLRIRWIRPRNQALYIGAGVSGGPHIQNSLTQAGIFAFAIAPMSAMGHSPPPAPRVWEFAKWANIEFGYERRKATGWVIRPYVGVAVLLNPGDSTVDAIPPEPDAEGYGAPVNVAKTIIYAGTGFGRAY
jgi:hypothetical protein